MNAPSTVSLTVSGMTCGSCRAHVERALREVSGVDWVEVDLGTGRAMVTYDPDQANVQQLIDAVRDAGYAVAADAPATLPIVRNGGSCCCM